MTAYEILQKLKEQLQRKEEEIAKLIEVEEEQGNNCQYLLGWQRGLLISIYEILTKQLELLSQGKKNGND